MIWIKNKTWVIPLGIFSLLLVYGMSGETAWGDNSKCLSCHRDKNLTKTDARGSKVSLFVSEDQFKKSVHGKSSCTDCHTRILDDSHAGKGVKKADRKVDCGTCHEESEKKYKASVHSLKAEISCKECHGHHYVTSLTDPKSATYRTNLIQTCGTCHPDESKQFSDSVHGVGLFRGRPNHPTCTTCHGTHGIKPRTDPESAVH